MKILVAYSSLTGNTKAVAEVITSSLGTVAELRDVNAVNDIDSFSCVIAGFWVDKGNAGDAMRNFLSRLHGKKVALFATMGANPLPSYGEKCIAAAAQYLPKDAVLLKVSFACLGKISPALIEHFKQLTKEHPHAMTPQKEAYYKEISNHPDKADLMAAADFAKKAAAEFKQYSL